MPSRWRGITGHDLMCSRPRTAETIMAVNFRVTAEELIRTTGARVTNARIEILATLLKADGALTHGDIESRLSEASGIDRVTVYRVLDWLTQQDLAHRISGDDRVWRFMINPQQNSAKSAAHGHHAHFTCETCGQTFCLDKTIPKVDVKLPKGFRPSEIDLLVRGRCAACA